MPKDHAMFEQYWIGQFADLLNAAGIPPAVAATSTVGKQVIAAVQAQIERARTPPPSGYDSRRAWWTVASSRHSVMGLMGDSMKPRER